MTHLKGQMCTTTLHLAAFTQHTAVMLWSSIRPQTLTPLMTSPTACTTYLHYHSMEMLPRQATTQPSD